jgi:hypothetical protein
MSDLQNRQSTDSANSSGFGTTQLSSRQPDVLKASKLQDGGASDKGRKEPDSKTGVR